MADPTPEPGAAPAATAPALDGPAPAVDAAQTVVNPQITDSLVVIEAADEAPYLTGAALAEVKAQAVGLALLNAVNAQQNAYVTANATVLAAVTRILALGRDTAAAETGAAGG